MMSSAAHCPECAVPLLAWISHGATGPAMQLSWRVSNAVAIDAAQGEATGASRCREAELLDAITDGELVPVMLSNVKLSMPGMQKAVQVDKKARKKGAG